MKYFRKYEWFRCFIRFIKKHRARVSVFTYIGLFISAASREIEHNQRHDSDSIMIDYQNRRLAKKEEVADSLVGLLMVQRSMIAAFITDGIGNEKDFENFHLPVWKKVKSGGFYVLVYLNKAHERQFLGGLSRYDLMGKTMYLVAESWVADIYQKHDEMASKSKEPIYVDEPFVMKNGTIIWLEVIKWRNWENTDAIEIWGIVTRIKAVKAK